MPVQVAFGPGDRVLTYLHSPEGSLERRLFALDLVAAVAGRSPEPREISVGSPALRPAVTEEGLSIEEQLLRERSREVGLGISSASWADEADVLLVPLPDGLHVVTGLSADIAAPESHLVVGSEGLAPILSPRLSPDGTKVAFVREGELHVVGTAPATTPGSAAPGSEPRRLTASASDGITNGLAEFIAQEEMDRAEGLWWSPDSRLIAFTEVDERHIPVYRIVHQGSDLVGPSAEEDHRYPFAGKANAIVRLGVIDVTGAADPTWMDTGDDDHYLARVHWLPDGGLVAELEPRDQATLRIVRLDPATGDRSPLHVETSEPYVNLHHDFRALESEPHSGEWIWSSERTGFRHLEVRSRSGELVRVLTSGEWQVDQLEAVDEDRGLVYFTGTKDGPTERHLYSVPLEGGEIERITTEPGTHAVVVGERSGLYFDRHGALGTPPVARVCSTDDGSVRATLHDRRDPRIDALGLVPPELVTISADDGTELHGLVYRPELASAVPPVLAAPPPLVVHVYGGPHAQLAVNDWGPTVNLRAQALRRLGFTVLVLDNRGSARRGLGFERALWHQMGEVEVADQAAGVRWAVAHKLADPARVGIYGWSYGGYMSLLCLARAGGMFRAAVAGAPVTHWDGYDTHYTERYMGTPDRNPTGYHASSPLTHVGEMEVELLLVHGLIDENVHFRHTARLINRLIAARKRYQLLCFPDERHLPRREEDRAFLEEQVIGWLREALSS